MTQKNDTPEVETLRVEGYAVKYGVPDDLGDVFASASLKSGATKMPINYVGEPVGVWTDLISDENGLRVEGVIMGATDHAQKAIEIIKGGASGLSIGFKICSSDVKVTPKGSLKMIKDAIVESVDLCSRVYTEGATIDTVDGVPLLPAHARVKHDPKAN